jgi:hypothetical protein
MKNRQVLSLALAVGAGVAFVAPFAVYAEGPSHFAPNEAGVVYHANEAGQAKSQAQVSAELADAQKTCWGQHAALGIDEHAEGRSRQVAG